MPVKSVHVVLAPTIYPGGFWSFLSILGTISTLTDKPVQAVYSPHYEQRTGRHRRRREDSYA